MFLPTYKPVLISDDEWEKIWKMAYEKLYNEPMFILQFSDSKIARALKFSFIRTIPKNPEIKRTIKDEILDVLEKEGISFDPTRHFIINVFVESFNKNGIAIFELWDRGPSGSN